MNTGKEAVKSSMASPSIGRITSLNMPSEKNGLNYDSLLRDMTTANDESRQHFDCSFWACAAVRG
jgi:hypothetical protein